MVTYINPGHPISASDWNLIFQEADAIFNKRLGGVSAVLSQIGSPMSVACERCFYFFDPLSPPSNLHPLAYVYLPGYQGGAFNLNTRKCVQADVDAFVAAQPLINYSPRYNVCDVALPSLQQMATTLWNTTQTSFLTNPSLIVGDSPSAGIGGSWVLDIASLKVLKRSAGGTMCNITFSQEYFGGSRSQAQVYYASRPFPWKMIDVFVVGNLTWDDSWDKYSVLRVHNCSTSPITFSAGALAISINPAASWCVRKNTAGGWEAQGRYFHWSMTGDPRFSQYKDANGVGASCFYPWSVSNLVSALASRAGRTLDATKFWDISSIYCNPNYNPVGVELAPPAGGYFPSPDTGSIGDLLVNRGEIMVGNIPTGKTVSVSQNTVMPPLVYSNSDFTGVIGDGQGFPVADFTPITAYLNTLFSQPTFAGWQSFIPDLFSFCGFNPNGGSASALVYPIEYSGGNVGGSVGDIKVTYPSGVNIPSIDYASGGVNWIPVYGLDSNNNIVGMFIYFLPSGKYNQADGTLSSSAYQPFNPYDISVGDPLVVNFTYTPPFKKNIIPFTGFEGLVSSLQASGISARTNSGGLTELFSSGVDLIDLSSPISTILTGNPASTIGSSSSSTPPSIVIPQVPIYRTNKINASAQTTAYSYYTYVQNPDGSFSFGGLVSVPLTSTTGVGVSDGTKVASLTDSLTSVGTFVENNSCAAFTSRNYSLRMTCFGPVVSWEDNYPFTAFFDLGYGDTFSSDLIFNNSHRNVPAALINVYGWPLPNGASVSRSEIIAYYSQSSIFVSGLTNSQSVWPNFIPVQITNTINPNTGQLIYNFSTPIVPWHFPRFNRTYTAGRFYQGDTTNDGAYLPVTGGQMLSNAWKSFFEFTPIGSDTPLPQGYTGQMTGISRMGAANPSVSDIWIPFSKWLAGNSAMTFQQDNNLVSGLQYFNMVPGNSTYANDGTFTVSGLVIGKEYLWNAGIDDLSLTNGTAQTSAIPFTATATTAQLTGYPNAMVTSTIRLATDPVSPTGTLTNSSWATVSLNQSSWYNGNRTAIIASATTGYPLPNTLPLMIEHYNMIASIINGCPALYPVDFGFCGSTLFTIDGSSLFVVSRGSGYAVGDTPAVVIVPGDLGITQGIRVTSVDSSGGITGFSPSAPNSAILLSATATPVRPFACTGGGSGATFDVSKGDGSKLSFLTGYSNIGVQTPAGFTSSSYWPRNSFFSWNGATPGGADPIADYFSVRGAAVQSNFPDGYGLALPSSDYGFSPAFEITALTYKWVTISDARSIYRNIGVPFVLNASASSCSFGNASATLSYGPITDADPVTDPTVASTLPYNWNGQDTIDSGWSGWSGWSQPPTAYLFVYNPAGQWLTSALVNISGPTQICKIVGVITRTKNIQYLSDIVVDPDNPGYYTDLVSTVNYTQYQIVYADWGSASAYLSQRNQNVTFTQPPLFPNASISVLAENTQPQIVCNVPRNFAYCDFNGFFNNSTNVSAYIETGFFHSAGGGLATLCPFTAAYIEDSHSTETSYIDGTAVQNGVPNMPEYVITTALANSTLVTLQVDGQTMT